MSGLRAAIEDIETESKKVFPDEEKILQACRVITQHHMSDHFIEYNDVYQICLDVHEATRPVMLERCSMEMYNAIKNGEVKPRLFILYLAACTLLDIKMCPLPK
jgi:hypothetical protein